MPKIKSKLSLASTQIEDGQKNRPCHLSQRIIQITFIPRTVNNMDMGAQL